MSGGQSIDYVIGRDEEDGLVDSVKDGVGAIPEGFDVVAGAGGKRGRWQWQGGARIAGCCKWPWWESVVTKNAGADNRILQ